ncbi:hypothetical protein Tco_1507929 [Tanacetum coccineum]
MLQYFKTNLNKPRYVSDKVSIDLGIESSDISSGDENVDYFNILKNSKREKALQSSTSTYRSRVPQAVLSRSTDESYYPRMDSRRPRISSYSPSSRSSTTRTPHRPQRPKKVVKSIWVKKGSTVDPKPLLPQTVKNINDKSKTNMRPKGNYLDSVNRDHDSYTPKQFDDSEKISRTSYHTVDALEVYRDKTILLERESTAGSKEHYSSGGITCLVAKATRRSCPMAQNDWAMSLQNYQQVGLKAIWASCKKIEERTVQRTSELLHMDLFGPVSVKVNRRSTLGVTDYCSKFSWVFFLAYKDETYDMLHDLIVGLENKLRHKVKTIRSPNISFMRPLGCSLTYFNTLDHLGQQGKVQDCLHVNFLENQENQKGKGPDWMFDLDLLTPSMNYIPQFIVHTTQPMPPEERTAAKEVKLSSEEQALHDELINLMHQESLAKAHNDDQRIAFEEEKRRFLIAKGKETCLTTFHSKYCKYTSSKYEAITPTISDDEYSQQMVFSLQTPLMLRKAE